MTFEQELEAIAAEMDDGEPQTPKEIAQHKVVMAVRDCYLASAEIFKLRCDPIAGPFVAAAEGDLWSIKGRVDAVISEIRAEAGELPLPKLRIVR